MEERHMRKMHKLVSLLIVLILFIVLFANSTFAGSNKPRILESSKDGPVDAYNNIISEKYVNNDISISYPQIANFTDEKSMRRVNELIKENALSVMEYYHTHDDLTIDVEYSILWKSDRLLSVKYEGYGYLSGGPYPNNLFYTSNIDLHLLKVLKFSELIQVDSSFIEQVQKNSSSTNPEHAPFMDIIFTEDLLQRVMLIDRAIDGFPNDFSYITENVIGLSFSVPHVMGDHMELEIKYSDILDNIRCENKIWTEVLAGNSL